MKSYEYVDMQCCNMRCSIKKMFLSNHIPWCDVTACHHGNPCRATDVDVSVGARRGYGSPLTCAAIYLPSRGDSCLHYFLCMHAPLYSHNAARLQRLIKMRCAKVFNIQNMLMGKFHTTADTDEVPTKG